MALPDLIRMINQTADFFAAYPHDVAVRETANHIRNFWEQRMRRELFDHVSGGGDGLKPIALEAARSLLEKA